MSEHWKHRAACASGKYDPDIWFPGQHEIKNVVTAKRVCREECPVRGQCAEYAVTFPMALNGIWGGLSRREIRSERRRRGLKVQSEAAFSGLPRHAES